MANQKGQGSSVFQLLVSAVVALAILGVLLGIIGGLPIFGSEDPITASRNALKSAYNQKGSPAFSSNVKLSKDKVFTQAGVTPEDLGVDRRKVCIGYSEEVGGGGGSSRIFEQTRPGPTLAYLPSQARSVKIGALCMDGQDLADEIDTLGWNLEGSLSSPQCHATAGDGASQTYCIIAILPP